MQIPPVSHPTSPASRPASVNASSVLFDERVEEAWRVDLGASAVAVVPDPAVPDGVLVRVNPARVLAVHDGEVSETTAQGLPARLEDGSEVRLSWEASADSYLREVKLVRQDSQGRELWSRSLGSRAFSGETPFAWDPVALPDGRVLVPRENGVESVAPDGSTQWTCIGKPYGNFRLAPSAGADGTAWLVENYMDGGMFGSMRSRVHGVGPDGSSWVEDRQELLAPVLPTRDGSAVVLSKRVGGAGTHLEKISAGGKVEWSVDRPEVFTGASEARDGALLLASVQPAGVVKLSPSLGEQWRAPLPASPVGIPIVLPDGEFIVGTSAGTVLELYDRQDLAHPSALPAQPDKPEIEVHDDWILVGGIRLSRRPE